MWTCTGQMFYWFVESQRDAAHAPVILWTNGGPGCSGLAGFLTEHGPFRVKADGKSLSVNHLAWNKIVNMVFIEQPVGVGFSKTDKEIQYGDYQAAEDNFKFVLGFFKRYPEYKGNDFYISSESYGGHYMPTLGKLLADRGARGVAHSEWIQTSPARLPDSKPRRVGQDWFGACTLLAK